MASPFRHAVAHTVVPPVTRSCSLRDIRAPFDFVRTSQGKHLVRSIWARTSQSHALRTSQPQRRPRLGFVTPLHNGEQRLTNRQGERIDAAIASDEHEVERAPESPETCQTP